MAEELNEGASAPDFDLPADGGGRASLGALKGKPIVLYFYPKDDTSGCTQEAVDFTRLKPDFDALGITILGVSGDSAASKDKFKAKHKLDVVLAADEDHGTLERYGVWAERTMYGKTYMGVERTTYLIDRSGKIARIWRKVKVPGHAEEVLLAAKTLPL